MSFRGHAALRPAVVRSHEGPGLARQVLFHRVFLDVTHDSTNVVRGFQKYLVRTIRPDPMVVRNVREAAKRFPRSFRECAPNRLGIVAMPSNAQMCVVLQHRTRPDRVSRRRSDPREAVRHRLPLRVIKPNDAVIQERIRRVVEVPQFFSWRLHGFSSWINRSKVGELLLSNRPRPAATRIVGQPVAVAVENQVRRDDDPVVAHVAVKRQAGITIHWPLDV